MVSPAPAPGTLEANSGAEPVRAWTQRALWHVLDSDFGSGLNVLRLWRAWATDPQRPQRLFLTVGLQQPPPVAELLAHAQHEPDLLPQAQALATQWHGLLPGIHRLVFEQARLHLTLCVGPPNDWLPTLDAPVDEIHLRPPAAQAHPPHWDAPAVKSLARLCRPGTGLHTTFDAPGLRQALVSGGFEVPTHNLDHGTGLRAVYAPRWTPKTSTRPPLTHAPGQVVVVGGGLSGSAVAWSLAQRGWRVLVLDTAPQPAAGASGLPAGLVAPHTSPDDAPLSRLSRAGVRCTLQRAATLLRSGWDWAPSGVLEHRVEGKRGLPQRPSGSAAEADGSRTATPQELDQAHLPPEEPALWHSQAGWIRPGQLVQAQLNHPLIQWQGQRTVGALRHSQGQWQALGTDGAVLAQAPQLVLASAWATQHLLTSVETTPLLPLHPLRGQITWGWLDELPEAARRRLPAAPVNGHGSFLHGVPGPAPNPKERLAWFTGSTFERGVSTGHTQPSDQADNLGKLSRLLPSLGQAMAPAWPQAQAWAGVRCTLPDRLPAVGPVDGERWPGLHVCTGMGARGLTLSVLCGELLAALWHGEPWPIERKLAQALLAGRWRHPASPPRAKPPHRPLAPRQSP